MCPSLGGDVHYLTFPADLLELLFNRLSDAVLDSLPILGDIRAKSCSDNPMLFKMPARIHSKGFILA